MKRFWLIVLTGSLVALAGCHSFKKENIQPPTPLAKDFKPTVQVSTVWTAHVGHGAGVSGVRMQPTVVDGVLYAASTDGVLAAYDAASGKTLWEKKTRPTAGSAGATRSVPMPTTRWPDRFRRSASDRHAQRTCLRYQRQRWQRALDSRVAVRSDRLAGRMLASLVIVRTQDGRVYGLDSSTGDRRWVNDQGNVPLLSLRGNGPLLVANGVIFFGSDDGKLIALRLDNGEKLWEQKLSSGEGRTDIDRMNDADGAVLLDGTTLYADAYHGSLTAVDGPSGRPLVGASVLHLHIDWRSTATAFSRLTKTPRYGRSTRASGADMWKSDALKYRWLTAPAVQGNYVVVGDIEGYVHWLQVGDGALAGRERLSKKAIRAQPVVVGDLAYVVDVQGHIAAYRLGAK